MDHFNMVLESSGFLSSIFLVPIPHRLLTRDPMFCLPAALGFFHDIHRNCGSTFMPTTSRESLTDVLSTICLGTYNQTFTLQSPGSSPGF